MTYQWTANGSPVGTGAQYTYMPNSSGDIRIGLHIADSTNPGRGADASPVTIHVNTYSRADGERGCQSDGTRTRDRCPLLHAVGKRFRLQRDTYL